MHFHSIFLLPSPGRNLHVDAILLHDHRKHENHETGNCENLHHVGIWKDMVVREVPYWTWLGNAHWSCLRPWPVPERHRSLTQPQCEWFCMRYVPGTPNVTGHG